MIAGIALLTVGMLLSAHVNTITPAGKSGMSDEEELDLLMKEQESGNLGTIATILMGLGFLLVIISFGARRKRKDGAKRIEKKPDVGM